MAFVTRSLSPQESRVVLSMAEDGSKEIERQEIIDMLGVSPQAADHVIRSLRRKGWLERASWGRYLLIPPEMGPDALGESNVLALASRIAEPYYFGYATAAMYYGFTTQHRQVVRLVTPVRSRNRRVLDTEVRIVNPVPRKFFGFGPIDMLGYTVMMSDREKTVIDCIDRPGLAGGEGDAATILGTACRRIDWHKAATYLETGILQDTHAPFRMAGGPCRCRNPRGRTYPSPRPRKGKRQSIFRAENPQARCNRLSGQLAAHRQRRQPGIERQSRYRAATFG